MINKAIASLLIIATLFCLAGCAKNESGKKRVLKNHYTEMPCYAMTEDATPEEMRQMAVKAFHDQLTVPWYVKEDFIYRKSSVGAERIFRIKSRETYGGLPYTNGNTGLLHWLQFYDFSTGELAGLTSFDFSHKYGNTCATGLAWGISSVCTSVNAIFCQDFVPRNGYYPVGSYDMSKFESGGLLTDQICSENGKKTMLSSYAEVKAGDVLDYCIYSEELERYSPHVIMAVEDAHVEYNADGSIDGRKSYVRFQDQHMGISSRDIPFVAFEDGGFIHYSGHRNSTISFNGLFGANYIPLTTAEFMGKAKYQKASVSLGKEEHKSFSELKEDAVYSNYNIITVTAAVSDGKKEIGAEKYITYAGDFKGSRISNVKLSRVLGKDTVTQKLEKGKEYNVKISVLVGSGEILTAFDGTVEYE